MSRKGKLKAYATQRGVNSWNKSIGLTSGISLDPIIKWGAIGALGLFVVYVAAPDAWSKLTNWIDCKLNRNSVNCNETQTQCGPGYHSEDPCANMSGLPLSLCSLGNFITGGALECKPDDATLVPEQKSAFGCFSWQKWCWNRLTCIPEQMECDVASTDISYLCPTGMFKNSSGYCELYPGTNPVTPDYTYYPPVYNYNQYGGFDCICNGQVIHASSAAVEMYGSCGNFCDSL
jgi:hypothetical protein